MGFFAQFYHLQERKSMKNLKYEIKQVYNMGQLWRSGLKAVHTMDDN